jgi:hypothetical protein
MRKELRPVHDLVPCDLCQRTILKGERIETFVVGGDRQQVCELCSFRAVRAGWLRESELEEQAVDTERVGPRRSLWSRALQWAEEQGLWGPPASPTHHPAAAGPPLHGEAAAGHGRGAEHRAEGATSAPRAERSRVERAGARGAAPRRREGQLEPDGVPGSADDVEAVEDVSAWTRRPARTPNTAALKDLLSGRRREPQEVHAVPTSREGKIERALELFNASEHRRTIAGVGRALGEPWVTATALGDGPTAHEVGIVVAWELSWYRYRVDLDDADQAVLLLDRGDEVEDLGEQLRAWNVAADADGRLALAVEAVS